MIRRVLALPGIKDIHSSQFMNMGRGRAQIEDCPAFLCKAMHLVTTVKLPLFRGSTIIYNTVYIFSFQ